MKKKLRRRTIIVVYIFLVFVLNSCSTPEERGRLPGDTATDASSTTSAHKVYSIEIKDMKFDPGEITVHKGDTVVWINHDMVTHCVTEENTKAWTSSNIAAGNSWKMVVQSGADYFCAIHQVMKGKILVE